MTHSGEFVTVDKFRCGECGGGLVDHRCQDCGTRHNGPAGGSPAVEILSGQDLVREANRLHAENERLRAAAADEDVERLRHLLAEAWGWLGVKPTPSAQARVDDLSERIMAEVEELLT